MKLVVSSSFSQYSGYGQRSRKTAKIIHGKRCCCNAQKREYIHRLYYYYAFSCKRRLCGWCAKTYECFQIYTSLSSAAQFKSPILIPLWFGFVEALQSWICSFINGNIFDTYKLDLTWFDSLWLNLNGWNLTLQVKDITWNLSFCLMN